MDKRDSSIDVVTDINSFVPVYEYRSGSNEKENGFAIGSHPDALALATGQDHLIDEVSIANFLTYKTVTFPYTMYRNIRQLPPASSVRYDQAGNTSVDSYWVPAEKPCSMNFKKTAEKLREILQTNVKRISDRQKTLGMMLSVGEDSRAIATMIPQPVNVETVTFVDSLNREARIAEQACKILGFSWKPAIRSPTHYLDHAASSIRLSESHNFFFHAHANSFETLFPKRARILGGLGADAFFKGARIQGYRKAGIMLKKDPRKWQYMPGKRSEYVSSEPSGEVHERRIKRNSEISTLRPQTCAEWHCLHPVHMNTNLTSEMINRRLFPSYEPFCDAHVVKLSSAIPQHWQTNRRLYHAAMKPVFKNTWSITHGKGFYPYYGLMVNAPLLVIRAVQARLRKYLKKVGIIRNLKTMDHGRYGMMWSLP